MDGQQKNKKPNSLQKKKDFENSPNVYIKQDFSHSPHSLTSSTNAIGSKDDEKMSKKEVDESQSDGSAAAFEGTENVKE